MQDLSAQVGALQVAAASQAPPAWLALVDSSSFYVTLGAALGGLGAVLWLLQLAAGALAAFVWGGPAAPGQLD